MTPHVWHVRRCTHREAIFTHSEHSRFAGCFTSLIREMSLQVAIVPPAPKIAGAQPSRLKRVRLRDNQTSHARSLHRRQPAETRLARAAQHAQGAVAPRRIRTAARRRTTPCGSRSWIRRRPASTIVTDGEVRRRHYIWGFLDGLTGVDTERLARAALARRPLFRDDRSGAHRRPRGAPRAGASSTRAGSRAPRRRGG